MSDKSDFLWRSIILQILQNKRFRLLQYMIDGTHKTVVVEPPKVYRIFNLVCIR